MKIIMKRSGYSLRHISHPKMYLAKPIWQLPKDKKQAYFSPQKGAVFLLLVRIIKHVQIQLPCRRKVYILSNFTEQHQSIH